MLPAVLALAALASFAEWHAPAPVARVGDRWLLEAEFHAHSLFAGAFPTPIDLVLLARHHDLDVLVVNEHNTVAGAQLARWFARAFVPDVRVIPAEEVTTRRWHMSIVGIEEAVPMTLPAEEVARRAHAQGAVTVANHPGGRARENLMPLAKAGLLDAAEAVHPFVAMGGRGGPGEWRQGQFEAFWRDARAASPVPVMAVAGSDYHGLHLLGWLRTFVLADAPTEQGFMEALRARRVFTIHPSGERLGDPETIAAADRAGWTPRVVSLDWAPHTTLARLCSAAALVCLLLAWIALPQSPKPEA